MATCYLCRDDDEDKLKDLISPCRCKSDSYKWRHRKCMEDLIAVTNVKSCVFCKADFSRFVVYKYSWGLFTIFIIFISIWIVSFHRCLLTVNTQPNELVGLSFIDTQRLLFYNGVIHFFMVFIAFCMLLEKVIDIFQHLFRSKHISVCGIKYK